MADPKWFTALNRDILACDRCPRLHRHCKKIAREKRAAFRDQIYHGGPVPNFGDPRARLLVLGLAPGAHGANRTGRMFTGDRSGDFLYRAMHEAGFANQPIATDARDGLRLMDAMITAVAHCAPPDNKPTRTEIAACADYLGRTFAGLPELRAVLCLGRLAFGRTVAYLRGEEPSFAVRQSDFRHGAVFHGSHPVILCSYHPSQQNTFTGRLTHVMLRDVFVEASHIVRREGPAK